MPKPEYRRLKPPGYANERFDLSTLWPLSSHPVYSPILISEFLAPRALWFFGLRLKAVVGKGVIKSNILVAKAFHQKKFDKISYNLHYWHCLILKVIKIIENHVTKIFLFFQFSKFSFHNKSKNWFQKLYTDFKLIPSSKWSVKIMKILEPQYMTFTKKHDFSLFLNFCLKT